MNGSNITNNQLRDFIVHEFLTGEHPSAILGDGTLEHRLSHAEAGLVRTEQFLNRLASTFQSLPQGQELQHIAQEERSLYGKIKSALHTEQNLRIAAIIGGAMLTLGLLALVTSSFFPSTGFLPSALEFFLLTSGLSFGAGGIACLLGTAIGKLVTAIQEGRGNAFSDEAFALQSRVSVLQNQGQEAF